MKMILRNDKTGELLMSMSEENTGSYPSDELEQGLNTFVATCINDVNDFLENLIGMPRSSFDVVDIDIYHNEEKSGYEVDLIVFDETKEPQENFTEGDDDRVLFNAKLTTV